MNLRNMKRGEDTEQIKVMRWAAGAECRYPELKWLHHIPNGGTRNSQEAIKLKNMGVKPGISDLHLPFPHGRYHGLYIELKYGKNRPTEDQLRFLCDMCDAGYCTAVCYDAEAAERLIEKYINLPKESLLYCDELEGTDISRDEYGIAYMRSSDPFA